MKTKKTPLQKYAHKLRKPWGEALVPSAQPMSTHNHLFAEELAELNCAKNRIKRDGFPAAQQDLADALGDMCVIVAGCELDHYDSPTKVGDNFWDVTEVTAIGFGINLFAALDLIMQSNWSKAVKCDEIEPTAEKYKAIGLLVEFRSIGDGLSVCVSAKDQYDNDGKFYPVGKVLKSVGFFEPRWSETNDWKLPG